MKHIENTLQSKIYKLIIKYNDCIIKEEYYLYKKEAKTEQMILEKAGYKCKIISIPNVYV